MVGYAHGDKIDYPRDVTGYYLIAQDMRDRPMLLFAE